MGQRRRKVGRHRVKRQKHRHDNRIVAMRQEQRAGTDAGALHACLVNDGWRENGKATILMARDIGPLRVAMAAFLVDLWAMGLKDAWGRTDISYSEFDEGISGLDAQLGTHPLNLGTAKHLVYGGIELSRELGFRLPRRYERWTAILGPLPKGETPDMSLFRCDGKIRLVCSMRDLESRLIGTTPDKFLARPDVDFILADDDFTLVDDEDDAVDDAITEFEQAMVDRARQWCFANGQTPHPLLPELIGAFNEALVQSLPPDFDINDEVDSLSDQRGEVMERMASFLAASFHEDPAAFETAMVQFDGFMNSVGSPEELFESLGLQEE